MTSKTEARILSIVVAFSFLLGAAAVAVYVHVTKPADQPLYEAMIWECERVDISSFGDDMLALIFSAGYKGDYRDGSDNYVYSPGCNIPTAPWLVGE